MIKHIIGMIKLSYLANPVAFIYRQLVWIIAITLCLTLYGWKLLLVLLFWTWANNTDHG